MIIQPKIRGHLCTTAHPQGCAIHVRQEIDYVRNHMPQRTGPRNVLVIGSSTGYGLSSRIAAAIGHRAKTIGVFLERPPTPHRTATAGWYNNLALERALDAEGIYAASINGDAFADEVKHRAAELVARNLGKLDLVVYSLAAPRRTHPDTGCIHHSVIKPIGHAFSDKSLDLVRGVVGASTLEPATQQEIIDTNAVMGGDDWQRWVALLDEKDLLAPRVLTVAYSYIGPSLTWPIYHHGTIGRAKMDLKATAQRLDERLSSRQGRALVSVNKAVVTQSSAAIPAVALYMALLFKVMKQKGIDESCIEQIHRLFSDHIYGDGVLRAVPHNCIRLDDLEQRPDVQAEITRLWKQVTTDNLTELSDIEGYRNEFLKLFGFGFPQVDYLMDTDPMAPSDS